MPRKPTGNPAGRPRTEINKKSFEDLCKLQCTLDEIAGFFDCSDRTIERWCEEQYGMRFVDVFKIKSVDGRISLRRQQFRLAEKSAAMAIFLGKQMLGQSDNPAAGEGEKLMEFLDIIKDGFKD